MSVVQAAFQGSTFSVGLKMKPPPAPSQTSRKEAFPYCNMRVSVEEPLIMGKKWAPTLLAVSARLSQPSQFPVQQHGFVSYICVRLFGFCTQYSRANPLTWGPTVFHQAAVSTLPP